MKKAFISDLDRTILPANGKPSKNSLRSLNLLEEMNYSRIIATGRSLYSANKVLDRDFPIDYLVFSSGAGIQNWKTGEIIYSQNLTSYNTERIAEVLMNEGLNFMVHYPIPDNHNFLWHKAVDDDTDFHSRIDIYKDYSNKIKSLNCIKGLNACQVLAIIPECIDKIADIRSKFDDITIIRATSPIDHKSVWLEFFPDNVSKGDSCRWLLKKLGIDINNTIGIGNDYNDIDMLEMVNRGYVVENSPEELKQKYINVPSDINDGFTYAVNLEMGQ